MLEEFPNHARSSLEFQHLFQSAVQGDYLFAQAKTENELNLVLGTSDQLKIIMGDLGAHIYEKRTGDKTGAAHASPAHPRSQLMFCQTGSSPRERSTRKQSIGETNEFRLARNSPVCLAESPRENGRARRKEKERKVLEPRVGQHRVPRAPSPDRTWWKARLDALSNWATTESTISSLA